LSAKKNSELRFKWTKLCLRAGRASILKHAASFAVEQGRMKVSTRVYLCFIVIRYTHACVYILLTYELTFFLVLPIFIDLPSPSLFFLTDLAYFLLTQFVRPLYRELLQAPIPGARELAIGTFAANKEGYHPICRKMVAADIEKLNGGASDKASGNQKASTGAEGSSDSGFVTAVVAAGFGAGVAVVLALSMAKRK